MGMGKGSNKVLYKVKTLSKCIYCFWLERPSPFHIYIKLLAWNPFQKPTVASLDFISWINNQLRFGIPVLLGLIITPNLKRTADIFQALSSP